MCSRVCTLLVILLLALAVGIASADQIYGIRDPMMINSAPRVYSLSVQDLATDGSPARELLVNLSKVEEPVIPGTFKRFACVVADAPTVPNVWTFTLLKNGAPQLLSCSVTGTNRSCGNDVNTVTVTTGDKIALEVSPSGPPVATAGACTVLLR